MRKTVELSKLTETVNHIMVVTSDDMTKEREALAHLVGHVLLDADNYGGFQYVTAEGRQVSTADVQAGNYDETRRRYSLRRK